MEIQILQLLEGAKQAKGLTVIIDVFRAFSLECYLADMGAKEILPVGSIERAYQIKRETPEVVLIGERGGKKCEGFDFGNSPSQVIKESIKGRTVVHTTSAGTQGVANAVHADEIISGSLVNAKAVADYIKKKNPWAVSLVAMGNGGVREAKEDVLCAEYIRALLNREPFAIDEKIAHLRQDGGSHFFNPATQEIFPEADFWMCIQRDRFPFVLRMISEQGEYRAERIDG